MESPKELILEQLALGPMENFQYFIGDKLTREIAIVDPAWEIAHLCQLAKHKSYNIVAVLLTHGHFDHSDGVDELLEEYDVPVYISEFERFYDIKKKANVKKTHDGDKIQIGNIIIECIHTPGHSPGGQCFRCKNILLTGDTLFIDGCGRCDLPGGNEKVMFNTLFNVISRLPDETIIYPGHNYGPTPFASLKGQKKTNPFLSAEKFKELLG